MPNLETVLGMPVRRSWWGVPPPPPQALVLAWGRKRSGLAAEALAERRSLRVLHVEDGFLRSVNPGGAPLSICLDDLGIYYDASRPSRLETLVKTSLKPSELERTKNIIQAWRLGRISKYNHTPEFSGPLPESYVLAVDQTRNDGSILYGQADEGSFHRMLEAALDEYPQATVFLKVHPEVVSGRKDGHFGLARLVSLTGKARIRVIGGGAHPCQLLEHAAAVYTVTSQVGFEALLWDKPVRVFGMPFYAGWGLTVDELPAPPRRSMVTLEQLVHAALIGYPRYVDPETGARCEAERLLRWMAQWRRAQRKSDFTG